MWWQCQRQIDTERNSNQQSESAVVYCFQKPLQGDLTQKSFDLTMEDCVVTHLCAQLGYGYF